MSRKSEPYDHFLWNLSKIFKLRFWFLASKLNARLLSQIYLLCASFFSIMTLGIAIQFCSINLIFPSLGPTIFMQFYAPSSPMSSPQNTVCGHLVGCIIGVLTFFLIKILGLLPGSTSFENILMLGLAVGLCGLVMAATDLLHPPAASTTLLIGFGYLGSIENVLVFMATVLFITYQSWFFHRLSGIKYPLWSPFEKVAGPIIHTKLGKLDLNKKKEQLSIEEMAQRLAARQRLDH